MHSLKLIFSMGSFSSTHAIRLISWGDPGVLKPPSKYFYKNTSCVIVHFLHVKIELLIPHNLN